MITALLLVAAILQAVAVAYGLVLRARRRAVGAWTLLLGAMLSMLAWRTVVVTGVEPPAYFNPLIAIWGSTCMVAAMFLFGQEGARRERVEAERDALLASERLARAEAERASRLKDEFLATLSHELRTPLSSILGWCTLMRLRPHDAEEMARAVDTIERNARAQARLVDDLLDATRMQAGKLVLDVGRVQLDLPVRLAVEAIRPAADAKGVRLDLVVPAHPVSVDGDADRLRQVAANLLTNAVKFTPQGGTVRVTVAQRDGRAVLAVADDGEGIDADFLPTMFMRFRQADSGTARRHGGLGLGLSIVESLVRLHGGEVTGTSDGRGTGATFTVTLPLSSEPAPAALPDDAAGTLPTGPDALAGIRLVLVDDEFDVRAVVARVLEQLGAQVVALESGAAVEETLQQFRPHALLIDIGMPGEDGYSLIRRIRRLSREHGGGVPAVSLTAHARNEDRMRAIGSGFQDHLPKPIDLPALVSTLRRVTSASADGRVH